MDLANKDNLIGYLKKNGLWARKGLSQNFLVDRNALEKIVGAGEIKSDDLVIEIGPGVGTMTGELVQKAGEVIAIEFDEKLAELLEQQFKIFNLKFKINDQFKNLKGQNSTVNQLSGSQIKSGMTNSALGMTTGAGLRIINDDILKVNLNEIIGDCKYKVIANIPYHITSKILELFLSRENKPETMVLLVQKEVAERVCAKPGEMSTLSVSVQLYGEPTIVDIVKKESFFPSPKVDSAILKIVVSSQSACRSDRLSVVSQEQEKDLFRLVHIGFASKRKTLVNNLSAGYHIPKEKASDIIKKAGLLENSRAQELGVGNWIELLKLVD